jgi:hypothetical protein
MYTGTSLAYLCLLVDLSQKNDKKLSRQGVRRQIEIKEECHRKIASSFNGCTQADILLEKRRRRPVIEELQAT